MINTNKILMTAFFLSFTLGSITAHAKKENVKPDNGTARDVIADANHICSSDLPTNGKDDQQLVDACALQLATNGVQAIGTKGCDDSLDIENEGNVNLIYQYRNCDQNENAQSRKASTGVVSLSDLIEKGKTNQKSTAADALCKYAEKYDSLVAVGKLVLKNELSEEDFGEDARDIARALLGVTACE